MRKMLRAGQAIGILMVLIFTTVICAGADGPVPKNDLSRLNYSIGYQVGADLKRQGVEIDAGVLLKGVRDAVSGHAPLLTASEMRDVLIGLQKRTSQYQEEKTKQEAGKNLAAGRAFLDENGRREGVVTLPSGLQYTVVKKGQGPRPKAGDTVTVHYRGTLIDGKEFDSSFRGGKPATFRADHVIPGWKEALPLMEQGSQWLLFVPPALGYGERRNGSIGPNSTLIFDIELISSYSNEK